MSVPADLPIPRHGLKPFMKQICQQMLTLPTIPNEKFRPGTDQGMNFKDLIFNITRDEDQPYATELGYGICHDDHGYHLSPSMCGTAQCDPDLTWCHQHGMKPIGTFHNHPFTTSLPSYNDQEENFLADVTPKSLIKFPIFDCIGTAIGDHRAHVLCLVSTRKFHGLKESHISTPDPKNSWEIIAGDHFGPFIPYHDRLALIRAGIKKFEADGRFIPIATTCSLK